MRRSRGPLRAVESLLSHLKEEEADHEEPKIVQMREVLADPERMDNQRGAAKNHAQKTPKDEMPARDGASCINTADEPLEDMSIDSAMELAFLDVTGLSMTLPDVDTSETEHDVTATPFNNNATSSDLGGGDWSPPHGCGLGSSPDTVPLSAQSLEIVDEEDEDADYLLNNGMEEEEREEFEPIPDDDESEGDRIADLENSKQKRTSLPAWLKERYADTRERLVSEMAKNTSCQPTCYDRGMFMDEPPSSWFTTAKKVQPSPSDYFGIKNGLTDQVVSFMRMCFQHGIGPNPFAEMIRTQHIRRHGQLHVQYLETILIRSQSTVGHFLSKFRPFGLFDDINGYAGFVPSPAYFRQFYVQFIASHAAEMDQHMAMLSAEVIRHLGKVSGETVFAGGLHTSINEMNEIRSMILTPSKAHAQFMPALQAISKSLETYGHKPIGAVMTDMPRLDKPELEKTLPSLLTNVVPVPDIATLPKLSVPIEWNVTQLGSRFQINTRLNTLMDGLADKERFFVAMDMEWSVDIQNGIQGPVALITIAFKYEIFLIPLTQYWHNGGLPNALLTFLRSPQICKIGVRINADLKRLFKDCGFTEKDQPFTSGIELGHLAKEKNIIAHAGVGLADLTSQVLRHFLPKDPSIRVSTAWDTSELTDAQKTYAALDVYATWQIFSELNSVAASAEAVTKATPVGTSVSLLSADRSTIVAHGFISPDQPKKLHEVNVTKTRIVITITSISVPGYIVSGSLMPSKQDTPFTSFPEPRFYLVCKLKHLQISKSPPRNCSEPPTQFRSNTSIIYSSEPSISAESGDDITNPLDTDQPSWYNEADIVSDGDQDPAQSAMDQASMTYATLLDAIAQTLETRTSDSSLKRSSVFGDIWHLMHQFPISMQHGLRRPFARALRDAFFLYDEEDKSTIEAFLATKGVKWDTMLQYHPKWLFQRVKRLVPPPEELYPRVSQVFQAFGPLKDAKTGIPLFNERCWNIAKNALENVRRGYYSDPPGVILYYPRKRDKFGLLRFRCCRGTNGIEGGIHQNIIRWFGSFNAAPDFAVELLRDYALYHNLKVGTFNRTGVPYKGSFDIWTQNRISHLLDLTSTRFTSMPPNFGPGGWVNSNNFIRSTEVFGILPLPLDFRLNLGMLVYHPEFAKERRIRQQYLAQRQDTRMAILPIHTRDERGLFKLLMAQSIANEPNWVRVAGDWNGHANGLTIFYKLPEHLKAYWKKWQENTNEKNSISINQAAFNTIVRALSLPLSNIPHVAASQPQSVSQQIQVTTSEAPATLVEPWQISNALGHHSVQQSAIQYYYGERPPPPSPLDKGKKRAAPDAIDLDDQSPAIKILKRKPRS
ncbi:hypothetical protein C0992_010900, partial [Termitomyces sp. T32_za158]